MKLFVSLGILQVFKGDSNIESKGMQNAIHYETLQSATNLIEID